MIVASLTSISAALIFLSIWWFVDRRGMEGRLNRLERLWLSTTVTWFITYKVVFGQAFFPNIPNSSTISALIEVLPGIIIGMLLFAQRVGRRASPNLAGILGLTFPLIGSVYIINGTGLSSALAVLVLLPTCLKSDDRVDMAMWGREIRRALLVISIVTATAVVLQPTLFLASCRVDKCTISGQIFSTGTGADGQSLDGNFLGVAVLLLVPWALCGVQLKVSLAVSLAATSLIELSGSRSSFGAAAVIVALVVLTRSFRSRWSAVAVSVFLLCSIAASVWTAVHLYKDQSFTYRGILWRAARKLVGDSPILGLGPGYWSSQQSATGFAANYSPHNVWLELAVAGGFVAVVTAVLIASITTLSLRGLDRLYLMTVWSSLVLIGTLEAPFQPYRTGLAPFILPLILLAADRRPMDHQSGAMPENATLPILGAAHVRVLTSQMEKLK